MKLRYYMRGLGIGIIVTAILLSISLHGKNKPMTDEQVIARAKELGMEEKYDNSVLAEVVSANDASDDPKASDEALESDAAESETSDSDVSEAKKQDDNAKVTETTENKQANEALDRAEQAKEDAKDSAQSMVQKTEGLADDAAKLKVENTNKTDTANTDSAKTDTGKTNTAKTDTDKTDSGKTSTDKTDTGKTDTDKTDAATKTEQNVGEASTEVTITVNGGDGSYDVAKKLQAAGIIEDSKAYDDYLCQNGYDRRLTTGKHVIKKGATQDEIAKELTTRVNK